MEARLKSRCRAVRCFLGVLLFVAVASTGCHWNPFRRSTVQSSPVAFVSGQPTLEELAQAINANTARIRNLQSQGATLSGPGIPNIQGDIALERPQRFRFRAGTTFTGPELDLGSNDELFWFWMKRSGPQPPLFFARHDQFAASPARQQLPVEPTWLMEGFGLTELNPAVVWEGPRPVGADRVEVRGQVQTANGPMTKSLIVHNRFGWLLEQRLINPAGQVVAQAISSQHDHSAVDGVTLAKHIEVSLPAMQAAFNVDVDRWQINSLPPDSQAIFMLPRDQLGNYPLVDLAAPTAGVARGAAPAGALPASGMAVPAGPYPQVSPAVGPNPTGYPSAAVVPQSGPYPQRMSHVPDATPRARIRGF